MRTLWLVVAFLLAVGVPFLAFSTQTVMCVDYTQESGLVSYCSSAPSLGWPGAVIVSLIALVLAAAAVRLSTRRPRP